MHDVKRVKNRTELSGVLAKICRIAGRDVAKFLGFETFILPDFRAIFGDDLRSYQEELRAIFTTLKSFYASEGNKILCAPVSTLLHSMPNAQSLQEKLLKVGDSIEFKNFKEDLLHFGYEFVDLVELSGEVSIRGDYIFKSYNFIHLI